MSKNILFIIGIFLPCSYLRRSAVHTSFVVFCSRAVRLIETWRFRDPRHRFYSIRVVLNLVHSTVFHVIRALTGSDRCFFREKYVKAIELPRERHFFVALRLHRTDSRSGKYPLHFYFWGNAFGITLHRVAPCWIYDICVELHWSERVQLTFSSHNAIRLGVITSSEIKMVFDFGFGS